MNDVQVFRNLLILCVFLVLTQAEYQWEWAVKIEDGETAAKEIADDFGFEYLGIIGNLDNMFHFRKESSKNGRFKRSVKSATRNLSKHSKISLVIHQRILHRQKRDSKITDHMIHHNIIKRLQHRRKVLEMFNDPKWPDEWYLFDSRFNSDQKSYDMRVTPVWYMNITGRGVKVAILDDGLEHTHPDLIDNYDPFSSTDLNDNDDDPSPDLTPGTSNEHGTRCASEIAMSANNKICGVGIAYNCKIGGIRMLDGPVNGIIEAKSLGFNNNHIDIYSSSWGPLDDGKTMEQPSKLVQEVLRRGALSGRNGKGNIFVWASGNGGLYQDSCSCDGYVSSLYVISVNSITDDNKFPYFAEKCPSTMCATYSASSESKYSLIAADVKGKCTKKHSGTSASAPYASGIFALVLEMNPNLTWRDIKHLIAWTSEYNWIKNNLGWKKNAAGFWVNEKFGFGLLNAYKMVKKAQNWKNVPPMTTCRVKVKSSKKISNKLPATIIAYGNHCKEKVAFIESIIILMNITYEVRGALLIKLQSPYGMNTTLLTTRNLDKSKDGIINWPFHSVHNWGENPTGKWVVYVEDKINDDEDRSGEVTDCTLEFYGTKTTPDYIKNSKTRRRDYDETMDEDEI